ncbi:hypothetical protein TcWFU_000015 [Taenia crassiceps]|uniref:Uncharacterized protein n=1 Tax=Taenia crassiceps TaxID=6207 RepID=A0ABR4QKM8_9CEST
MTGLGQLDIGQPEVSGGTLILRPSTLFYESKGSRSRDPSTRNSFKVSTLLSSVRSNDGTVFMRYQSKDKPKIIVGIFEQAVDEFRLHGESIDLAPHCQTLKETRPPQPRYCNPKARCRFLALSTRQFLQVKNTLLYDGRLAPNQSAASTISLY